MIAHTGLCKGRETMEKRKLGKSNLEVSAIGLGCMSKLPQRSSLKGQDAQHFPAKLVGRQGAGTLGTFKRNLRAS
jgi:hypothetical protein